LFFSLAAADDLFSSNCSRLPFQPPFSSISFFLFWPALSPEFFRYACGNIRTIDSSFLFVRIGISAMSLFFRFSVLSPFPGVVVHQNRQSDFYFVNFNRFESFLSFWADFAVFFFFLGVEVFG